MSVAARHVAVDVRAEVFLSEVGRIIRAMTEGIETTPSEACTYCRTEVTLTPDRKFPPHLNAKGSKCLGPEARRAEPVPFTASHSAPRGPNAPAYRGGPHSLTAATSHPSSLPAWIRNTAKLPAAGPIAWGFGLLLVGTVVSYIGFFIRLDYIFTTSVYSDGSDGAALLLLGGLLCLVGIVTLCFGLTRLAAKADIAFDRSLSTPPSQIS